MKYYAKKDLSAQEAASAAETRFSESQCYKRGEKSTKGQEVKRLLAANRLRAKACKEEPQSPDRGDRSFISAEVPNLARWGGKRRIRSKREFNEIYSHGRNYTGELLVLKILANDRGYSRAAFSTGKKLGKATARNRAKRLMRESLRSFAVKPGWDLLFLSRLPAMKADFHSIMASVKEVLKRAGILEDQTCG